MSELNLENIREEISNINKEMLDLFVRRMELSAQVAQYKKENGLPTLDRKREEAVMQSVADNCPEQYRTYALELFREIMKYSRDYQDSLR